LYEFEDFRFSGGRLEYKIRAKFLHNVSLPFDVRVKGKTAAPKLQRIKKADLKKIAPLEDSYHPAGDDFLYGRRLAADIVRPGRIILRKGSKISADTLKVLRAETETDSDAVSLKPAVKEHVYLLDDVILDDGEVVAKKGDMVGAELLSDIEKAQDRKLERDIIITGSSDGRKKHAFDKTDVGFGEVIAEANTAINEDILEKLRASGIRKFQTLYVNEFDRGPFIAQTMAEDRMSFNDAAYEEEKSRETIYRMLRPGDPPNREVVNNYLDAIFYDSASYSLSRVGRMKFNRRLYPGRPEMEHKVLLGEDAARANKSGMAATAAALVAAGCFSDAAAAEYISYVKQFGVRRAAAENLTQERADEIAAALSGVTEAHVENQTTLSRADILAVVKYLVDLRNGREKVDDIDNLSNRRVRAVGEFIENHFYLGLLRVSRAIRDRLSRAETDELMPHNLISAKAVSSSVSEFFNGNQLSQFMDQTNPLAEITHKRRVSAFGVGGLNRDRVGFEVRDVHPSHYGRICPIETPEGPNIGLINSMALYAEVDKYGFLRTPYVKVKDGAVTGEVVYLSAIDEQG
ncbi:MAG: hypothetical protein HAW59_00270, partial [Betaproteobacteria bacterium]|nr:hypothetical protein [Betaproteobacteria bacterium]